MRWGLVVVALATLALCAASAPPVPVLPPPLPPDLLPGLDVRRMDVCDLLTDQQRQNLQVGQPSPDHDPDRDAPVCRYASEAGDVVITAVANAGMPNRPQATPTTIGGRRALQTPVDSPMAGCLVDVDVNRGQYLEV